MKRVLVFLICIMLAACSAGCGGSKPDAVQSDTCFIYTDGLLDDLCAIEYLAESYDNAVIFLQDPDGLAANPYASDTVTDQTSLLDAVSPWFTSITVYSDSVDISETDFYLLGPLTEFAEMLEQDPSLKSRHALLVAGDSDGPDGAGEDWNAVMDIDAYRYVTGNMTDCVQMTRPDCEGAYEANGYPFEAEYLDEYMSHMSAINENLCCYDLQAVALYLQ